MTLSYSRAALRVACAIASILTTAGGLEAQGTCSEALSRAGARVQEYNAQLARQGADFVVDAGASAAIGGATQLLKNSPVSRAGSGSARLRTALEMDVFRQDLEAWETVQKTFAVTVEDLVQCMAPGSGCSLQGFIAKQNAAFQRWMETLLPEGTQGALERVRKVRTLLQSNVGQAGSDLLRTTREAVACMKAVSETARAEETVDLTGPASPVAAAPARGGLGGGTKALIFLGTLGGGAYLAKDSIASLLNGGACVGAKPDVSACYSGNGNGPGCQPALVLLEAYCASCGMQRGTNASATDCVAK